MLGLPTRESWQGGGLTVWDGDGESERFDYPVAPGQACLLDARVWHQSNPITDGVRWVLVIFYAVRTARADGLPLKGHAAELGRKT